MKMKVLNAYTYTLNTKNTKFTFIKKGAEFAVSKRGFKYTKISEL